MSTESVNHEQYKDEAKRMVKQSAAIRENIVDDVVQMYISEFLGKVDNKTLRAGIYDIAYAGGKVLNKEDITQYIDQFVKQTAAPTSALPPAAPKKMEPSKKDKMQQNLGSVREYITQELFKGTDKKEIIAKVKGFLKAEKLKVSNHALNKLFKTLEEKAAKATSGPQVVPKKPVRVPLYQAEKATATITTSIQPTHQSAAIKKKGALGRAGAAIRDGFDAITAGSSTKAVRKMAQPSTPRERVEERGVKVAEAPRIVAEPKKTWRDKFPRIATALKFTDKVSKPTGPSQNTR